MNTKEKFINKFCRYVFKITAILIIISAFSFSCGWTIPSGTVKSSDPENNGNNGNTNATTRVIANWDFVPDQYITSSVNVGVIAFHESGVDVEFEINGVKTRVTKPLTNPQTKPDNLNTILNTDVVFQGIHEYWITVNPADYADGPIVIKATAYPDGSAGVSKVLPDLTLYKSSESVKVVYVSNSGNDTTGDGTIGSPYLTIEKGFVSVGAGGIVRVTDGNYSWKSGVATGGNYTRWTTITSDSGNPSGVIVTPTTTSNTDGFYQDYVKWLKVTIKKPVKIDLSAYAIDCAYLGKTGYHLWFDNCIIESYTESYIHPVTSVVKNVGTGEFISGQLTQYYISDCYIKDFATPGGWWERNCVIENVSDDVWRSEHNALYTNIEIRGMYPKQGAHPDMIQFYNPARIIDNVIFYNIKALNMLSQGIFGSDGSNIAFVNLLMDKPVQNDYHDTYMTQVTSFQHFLLWHCSTYNHTFFLGQTGTRSDWNVSNNILNTFINEGNPSSIVIAGTGNVVRKNHYTTRSWNQSNGCVGDSFTGCPVSGSTSDPGFADPANKDFRINSGSLTFHAGEVLECVPADINGNLFNTSTPTIGAFAGVTE